MGGILCIRQVMGDITISPFHCQELLNDVEKDGYFKREMSRNLPIDLGGRRRGREAARGYKIAALRNVLTMEEGKEEALLVLERVVSCLSHWILFCHCQPRIL